MDNFERAIRLRMEEETLRIIGEEANSAAERTKQRVRAMAGQIATEVAAWVNYDLMRDEIRITVKLPERKS